MKALREREPEDRADKPRERPCDQRQQRERQQTAVTVIGERRLSYVVIDH
jgi:hypothetical protein